MSGPIKPKPAAKAKAPSETFTAYKGFDKNLQCRGFQYEVGRSYTHTGKVVQCKSGFHVCQNPLDVLDFYELGGGNRFAKVTVGGKVDRSDDKKWAAAELTVNVELKLPDLISEAIRWIMDTCKGAGTVDTGNFSQLAASGDFSQLAASGNSSKLAASGDFSKLAASGDFSKLAASGNFSQLAASGNSSQLAASGDFSKLAASGDSSKLAASGDFSKLEASGAKSAAAAVGLDSRVKASTGTPVAICEYNSSYEPIGFATGVAGKDGVPADTWLIAKGGKLVAA
jgi:hypothetical protein